MQVARCEQHTSYEGMLESPFEPPEIHRAIQAGERKKAPGNDELACEFYSHNCAIIRDDLCEVINQMFWAGNISQQRKRGVIFCLPKAHRNQTPEDYRPTTLLNLDYKILARIIAQRLCPVLADHLTKTPFCMVPGNTIMDSVATVRDTIAYAESRRILLCVLSLDFKMPSSGSPTTTCFENSKDTALETPLSPVSI